MTGLSFEGPTYREPGALARIFVYTFALAAPLLTIAGVLLTAAIVVRGGVDSNGIVVGAIAGVGYLVVFATAVHRVRVLAARVTPPLPLPGDIWNIGVAPPPRRSRNWPIRFRWRRPPNGGKAAVERLAA
jgi:hypothetical protein